MVKQGVKSVVQFIGDSVLKAGCKTHFRFWWYLYLSALKGINAGEGGNVYESGEYNVIHYMKKKESPVIFDVGANIGKYTNTLLEEFSNKNVEIHSFEPSKKTFETLSGNVSSPKVYLYNIGMSDTQTEACLYSDGDNSEMASLYDRQLDNNHKRLEYMETICLDTIDHFCETNHISHIDLLKLDVEGNELKALKGG